MAVPLPIAPDAFLPRLYGFFRSGTSHRVRIALNLKGLDYQQVAVDLRKEEHNDPAYKAINPQQLVPALDIGETVLTQSPAILEWLEGMSDFTTKFEARFDTSSIATARTIAAATSNIV